MESVLQKEKECFLCRYVYDVDNVRGLEAHHVFFGTANRKKSEETGMKIWLCKYHHTGSKYSVHGNRNRDLIVKKYAQRIFEEDHSREEFIDTFGRSYL